jgi:MoxR-like ATPase
MTDIRELNEKIQAESAFVELILMELDKTIVGQKHMVERLLIALLSNGHILLEGVPGLAKTLAIKSLASCIDAKFSRLQFTPDLLPADLLGTMIYNQKKEEFVVKQGPVFANFVLADEINRVTIGENTFKLPEPFLVLATQNPVEQEGTYPLPEAQVDRFMLKVLIGYPTKEDEKKIIRQNLNTVTNTINTVLKPEDVVKGRNLVKQVYMDEKIEQYIVDIVFATRYPEQNKLQKFNGLISFGGSPRASISLAQASKAHAFIKRRGYVIPEDVRAVSYDVLRHRIGLTYEAEAENITTDQIITEILNTVEVP